jgi:hypothetical protein
MPRCDLAVLATRAGHGDGDAPARPTEADHPLVAQALVADSIGQLTEALARCDARVGRRVGGAHDGMA